MAETSIPGLSQSSSIVLHNGKAALPIKAGQANVFKAKAGEHYRVLKGKEGEEQFLDNVVVKHAGADLKLEYTDGTQVTLENYYVECKAGDCDVTVPGKTGEGYKINPASTSGATLGDGSTLVYAHGSPDALMGMAQGNAAMQTALASLKGAEVTYVPSAFDIGGTNPGLLVGGLGLAALGGGGGGGGGGGSSSSTSSSSPVIAVANSSGSIADGYISNALVFRDVNNNAIWDRETFTDVNNNGIYDTGETFVDANADGFFTAEA